MIMIVPNFYFNKIKGNRLNRSIFIVFEWLFILLQFGLLTGCEEVDYTEPKILLNTFSDYTEIVSIGPLSKESVIERSAYIKMDGTFHTVEVGVRQYIVDSTEILVYCFDKTKLIPNKEYTLELRVKLYINKDYYPTRGATFKITKNNYDEYLNNQDVRETLSYLDFKNTGFLDKFNIQSSEIICPYLSFALRKSIKDIDWYNSNIWNVNFVDCPLDIPAQSTRLIEFDLNSFQYLYDYEKNDSLAIAFYDLHFGQYFSQFSTKLPFGFILVPKNSNKPGILWGTLHVKGKVSKNSTGYMRFGMEGASTNVNEFHEEVMYNLVLKDTAIHHNWGNKHYYSHSGRIDKEKFIQKENESVLGSPTLLKFYHNLTR